MNWLTKHWRWLIINLVALALFVLFVGEASAAGFTGRAIKMLVEQSGTLAQDFLWLSLAMTPLNILFGWRSVLQLKKSTGLWAFAFATLHLVFYALERGNVVASLAAIPSEAFLLIGLLPLLIMLPLAITSTSWWMQRLGKSWKPLHRLVYLAGVGTLAHVALLRHGPGGAIVPGILLIMLLVVRVPQVKQVFVRRRQQAQLRRTEAGHALKPTAS